MKYTMSYICRMIVAACTVLRMHGSFLPSAVIPRCRQRNAETELSYSVLSITSLHALHTYRALIASFRGKGYFIAGVDSSSWRSWSAS